MEYHTSDSVVLHCHIVDMTEFGLFHGQLSNIETIDSVFCFVLTNEMNLKTVNVQRTIPVHPKLIELGFLDFVKKMRQRLFPELDENRPKPTGVISSWWNETYRKQRNITREKTSLYSLRHNIATQLRNNGILETFAAEILGHPKGNNITYQRYGSASDLEPLQKAIESLTWPDVNFKKRESSSKVMFAAIK